MVNKQDVVKAVNYLIQSPAYTKLIREITSIIERWDTHPMAYAGDLAVLNSMINVGLESREAFEKLVSLIDAKRKLLPEIRRIDYQRDLMRERRARLAKAVELHELEGGRLISRDSKAEFMRNTQRRWRTARDEFIKNKGTLSWHQRNAATQEFWDAIDRKLDADIRLRRRGH